MDDAGRYCRKASDTKRVQKPQKTRNGVVQIMFIYEIPEDASKCLDNCEV